MTHPLFWLHCQITSKSTLWFFFFLGGLGGMTSVHHSCKVDAWPLKSHLHSFLLWQFLGDEVSWIICLGWLQPTILLISRKNRREPPVPSVWFYLRTVKAWPLSANIIGKCLSLWNARKLCSHWWDQKWPDKKYKKAHLGTALKANPFEGTSYTRELSCKK
jgi:hypothetical protein